MTDPLRAEKLDQLAPILREMGIDCWLIYTREVTSDPMLGHVCGLDVTWRSAFLFTALGERVALVGELDRPEVESSGLFTRIEGYQRSIRQSLRVLLEELDPRQIGINVAMDDPHADGLTHGMHQDLLAHLAGTPYSERLTSAGAVVRALLSRKTETEMVRIRRAAQITMEIFDSLDGRIVEGISEKQVSSWLEKELVRRELEPAWWPATVSCGPDSPIGHGPPGDHTLEAGQLLHVDLGVKWQGYCSDFQRVWFLGTPGQLPDEVCHAFQAVSGAIDAAAKILQPGATGAEVDAAARNHVTSQGFPEYPHALGHQVGRSVHDGGTLLAPVWERYGQSPFMRVEPGSVFTLELEVSVSGRGLVSLEEMVRVEPDGLVWLAPRQTEPRFVC